MQFVKQFAYLIQDHTMLLPPPPLPINLVDYLACFSNLKSLNISRYSLDQQVVDYIFTNLVPRLSKLSLTGCSLNLTTIPTSVLRLVANVEHLDFSDSSLSVNSLSQLANAIKEASILSFENVLQNRNNNNINNDSSPKLTTLIMAANGLTENRAELILEGTRYCKSIRLIDLSYNKIKFEMLEQQFLFLRNHPVETLILKNNWLGNCVDSFVQNLPANLKVLGKF